MFTFLKLFFLSVSFVSLFERNLTCYPMNEDRYEIREKIGQGGVGAVYKAYDQNLNREVAIKRVLTDEGFDANDSEDGATKALLKEAIALCSIQHPHIVTVYDAGVDDEGPYVVMELLSGKTMDEIDPMTWSDFSETSAQTLEALIAAQQLNLVHRDIKPSNVMINYLPSGRFQVKLVDFGLAKFSSSPSLQTIDHGDAVFGSIHFMAPEQFERIPLDQRTDMYSLGCVFYFALTGAYPFDGETAPQVMASHLSHTFTPLKELRPDIPDWACQWVEWHMARNMEDRPASAQEAMERFNSFSELDRSTGPVHVAPVTAVQHGNEDGITGPVPTRVNRSTSKTRLITGAISPLTAAVSPRETSAVTESKTASTPLISSGEVRTETASTPLITSAEVKPQTATAPTVASTSKTSSWKRELKKNPVALALAATIVIGFFIAGIVMIGKSGGDSNKEMQALLEKASNPLQTELAMNSSQLDSLLTSYPETSDSGAKQNIERALLLAKAADGKDVDLEIANFATQSNKLAEEDRVKLFQVLERRGNTSPRQVLVEFVDNSSEHDAVVAALKATRGHISEAGVSTLLNLISNSPSKQVRKAAEQTVAQYFQNKSKGGSEENVDLSQAKKKTANDFELVSSSRK